MLTPQDLLLPRFILTATESSHYRLAVLWRAGEQNPVPVTFELTTVEERGNGKSELTNRNVKWGEGAKVEAIGVAVYKRGV